DLRKQFSNKDLTAEQSIQGYRALLKDDPPEEIARDVRGDLYKLLTPAIEAQRQLLRARELLAKGGFDIARKLCEQIRTQNSGTQVALDAEKQLKEIADREAKASEDLSKIQKLILQKKTEDARKEAKLLIASNPPEQVLMDV